jgi:hypothetical protein
LSFSLGHFPDPVDTLAPGPRPRAWTDTAAFLDGAPERFRLDRTRGQDVTAEKDTLRRMFGT